MNIIFTKLRYKNILSTGDIFTEIQLNKDKTTLISGSNGAGKSTIIEAISFALYGKPYRKINKPQLLNSINKKDLLIELEFFIGDNKFLIKRGMKPTIFEIWQNGEMINQNAASRDYQEYLENNILQINYKSFCQIIVLGSATYTPFMELSAAGRREIIEDLLDIQIFSTMNLLLKDKISENKTLINDTSHDIELIKTKIESAEDHNKSIMDMKKIEADKIKEKIKEHLAVIETENSHVENLQTQITQLIETISDKKKQKNKLDKTKTIRSELYSNLRAYEKELSFYHDNDNCPTCKQGIEHNFKETIVNEKSTKKLEMEDGIQKIENIITDIEARIDDISKTEDEIQKLNLQIGEHRSQVKLSMGVLKGYKKELTEAENELETFDLTKINELKSQLKSLESEQTSLYDYRETLGVIGTMLKDGGIKTRIIRQYIPIINKLINKYLAAFDLFVDFQLDENFNEVIKSRFRDKFSYLSFSEGEKLRISLSIMLAWRAVAKMRNSVSSNILVLDEVLDSAMDKDGIGSLIETIHNLNKNDNIFVISHRGESFAESFDSNIHFEKVKNFSQKTSLSQ